MKRGLYVDEANRWNADSVGAYNILRLYGQKSKKEIHMKPIKTLYVVKSSRVKSGSGVMDAPVAKLHDALAIQLPSNSR